MKKLGQKGFSAPQLLLVLIIVAMIGGVGYYVYQANQEVDKNLNTTQSSQNQVQQKADSEDKVTGETKKQEDISADWKRYKSGQGAFSIKIADGMSGINDTSGDIIFISSYSKNKSTTIKDVSGSGSDAFFVLTIHQSSDSNPWTPKDKDMLNLKKESFTTSSGVGGTKQTFNDPYEPPCEGPGCYLGTKRAYYDFKNGSKIIRVVYSQRVLNAESKRVFDITKSDPDLTKIVDAMVKSLEISN